MALAVLRRLPDLAVLEGGRGKVTVAVARDAFEETHVELIVSRDDRIAHVAAVRQHLTVAMRALANGRYAMAGTWLIELERINEREAIRARSVTVEAKPCPDCADCVRLPGHGRAS